MGKALRTFSQFEQAVDQETAWRLKELTNIKFSVQGARDSYRPYQIRSGIALLYAHWEGWVKSVAKLFIEYVNSQKLPYAQLTAPLLGSALKTRIQMFEQANTAAVHADFGAFILSSLSERAEISLDLVRTESNLSSRVFRDIVLRMGVEWGDFELKANFIDAELVDRRNTVAHGSYLNVDEAEFIELLERTRLILADFTNALLNSAATRAFCSQ